MLCRRDDSLQDVILENFNGWQYDSETAFVQKVRYFLEHTEEIREMLDEMKTEYSLY